MMLKRSPAFWRPFFIFISHSEQASSFSSFLPLPKVLPFQAYHRRTILRGRNPGRDGAEWFSPVGSFRYEVHPMWCFHYPPPRYSHRLLRWKSTYRMPWYSYLKIFNFHPNSQNYCQLTRYLKYGNINLIAQRNATFKKCKGSFIS